MANEREKSSQPCREKYWSELDGKQKAERMREQVKYLQGAVHRLSDIVTALRYHLHHESGQLLVPFEHRGPMTESRPRGNNDKVYF